MFLGCKLYKLNPSVDSEIKKILLTKKESHKYQIEKMLDYEDELYFYVHEVHRKEGFASIILFYYDDFTKIQRYDKEEGRIKEEKIKITQGPVRAVLFEKYPLDNYLGILSNKYVAERVQSFLRGILKLQNVEISRRYFYPLIPILVKIAEKKSDIMEIDDFEEVKEILVEQIRDYYVDWAWIKGSMLDQSDEYRRYVEDELTSGKLRLLTIVYKGRTYYLYRDGRIFTKQADTSSLGSLFSEVVYLYEIAQNLIKVGAIEPAF